MVYEWKMKYLYKKIYKIIYVVLVKDNENIKVVKMVVNIKRVEILFFFLVDVLFLIIIFVILF